MSETKFTLRRFNPRRAARNAPAAEVECEIDGGVEILWMSPRDIRRNIEEFGAHDGLLLAKEHHRTRKEYESP